MGLESFGKVLSRLLRLHGVTLVLRHVSTLALLGCSFAERWAG
jgi:hypothetical protein